IHERIEYLPGSGRRTLFPTARLDLCDVPCNLERLTTSVDLVTQHIGKDCDRDTYSVQSQRKLCGASTESVDLLPTADVETEWIDNQPTDDRHRSDQIYQFDGATNAVMISEFTLNHNLTDNFTVSFWMKHEPPLETNDTFQHTKEHVLCNADDHKHNRHHYSIFIRNCRLILLLRREFNQEQPNVFKPAEWRWKLSEVCDNQWHHYAVSINFPEVILYLDGQTFKEKPSNYEVIDDWPLHKMKNINTTLVVGACWQGRENKMNFHFRGYLAGLSVLRGQTENPDVLRCLHRCKEGLEEPSSSLIESNTEVFTNSDQTQVTIEGISKMNMEDLVAQVAYINSREYPSPGLRSLTVATTVTCGNGSILKVPTFHSYIIVLQPDQPTIGINGTSNLAREYDAFKQGIELFSTVSVVVTQRRDQELIDAGLITQQKLDTCKVQVYPPLNHDHEYFKLPTNVMDQLGIHYRESKDGLLIYGTHSSHNYEMLLREIVYYNHKPAYYLNRAFKLVCSGLNGRFISNEYIQTLTVIHPRVEPSHEVVNHMDPAAFAHAQIHDHQVELQAAYVTSKLLENSEAVARTSASHTVTVIIIICVGFLVFMIVLGVIRIRAAHRRSQGNCPDDHEMAWDGSSLTITVNPMEQVQEIPAPQKEQTEDSDSSDEGSCCQEDEADSSEEETEKPRALELDCNSSKHKI
ncbi:calsyntenin-1-like, partial [Limulus polyphemus]|uniref:Calsyntenin-1-like n=1 Tax=Limulus polyphemus TaxID=6850 RepID=A0ABM1BVN3_LIMPO